MLFPRFFSFFPKVFLILRPPELFAVATIHITQGPSNERVCSLLAQFRLQGLHQRNQDLSLDFGLLNEGNAHAQPLVLSTVHSYSSADDNTHSAAADRCAAGF